MLGLFFSVGVPCLLVGVLGAVVFYFASKLEEKEKDTFTLNGGYGSASNPLPADRQVRFENMTLRIEEIINPATRQLTEISGLDPYADPTRKYILLWITAECEQEMCYGSDVRMSLIDDTGDKVSSLDDAVFNEFAADSARYGRELKGWRLFEIAFDREPMLFEIIYDRVALYQYADEPSE